LSDHTHDQVEAEQTFMIPDEQGNEHEMVLVYTFESDEQTYAVLLEKNNLEADGVIFRIEEENDEAFLVSIQDDEEWERVVTVYNEEIAAQEAE
jgi:uncharacterized protein YrzB (UPF0473 family)